METVLFVCSGNTCRSPMAEAIARHHLGRGLLGEERSIFVASAGVLAADGMPTSEEAFGEASTKCVITTRPSRACSLRQTAASKLLLPAPAAPATTMGGPSATAAPVRRLSIPLIGM